MVSAPETPRPVPFRGRLWRYARTIGLALALAFSIRAVVAEEFRAVNDAVTPAVPRGSRLLVYKLATHFAPDDVLVFRDDAGGNYLGRVVRVDPAAQTVTIDRNGEAPRAIGIDRVVGRVVLNTR